MHQKLNKDISLLWAYTWEKQQPYVLTLWQKHLQNVAAAFFEKNEK